MYALTVKKTGKSNYVENGAYDEIIDIIQLRCGYYEYVYELDSKNRLHIHFLLSKNPYQYLVPFIGPYHIKIYKIYNIMGWLNYIKKSLLTCYCHNNEAVFIDNDVKNSYMFVG